MRKRIIALVLMMLLVICMHSLATSVDVKLFSLEAIEKFSDLWNEYYRNFDCISEVGLYWLMITRLSGGYAFHIIQTMVK